MIKIVDVFPETACIKAVLHFKNAFFFLVTRIFCGYEPEIYDSWNSIKIFRN